MIEFVHITIRAQMHFVLIALTLFIKVEIIQSQAAIDTFHTSAHQNNNQLLFLYENGTFLYTSRSGDCTTNKYSTDRVFGDFEITSKEIFFNFRNRFVKNENDFSVSTPKDLYEKCFLNKNYNIVELDNIKMLILKYDRRTSLSYADRINNIFLEIIHQINSSNNTAKVYEWCNSNRTNRVLNKDIKSSLPENYRQLLLDNPIDIKVESIEKLTEIDSSQWSTSELSEPCEFYKLTFNKGFKDGISEGMRLFHPKGLFKYVTIVESDRDKSIAILRQNDRRYPKNWRDYDTFSSCFSWVKRRTNTMHNKRGR